LLSFSDINSYKFFITNEVADAALAVLLRGKCTFFQKFPIYKSAKMKKDDIDKEKFPSIFDSKNDYFYIN
jgi:hypothetical protein